MKEVKIVCIYNGKCPIPYDEREKVPLTICLECGGLYVIKRDKDEE